MSFQLSTAGPRDRARANTPDSVKIQRLTTVVISLLNYCKGQEWAGIDPYDALNSRLFAKTVFHKSRVCRIAFTQFLKRFPINLRPVLMIKPEVSAKAIALFLKSSLKLSKLRIADNGLVTAMIEKLAALRSPGIPYWCWGYSFPWQGRSVLVPKDSPNLVCTFFVGSALLDAYEETGASQCLEMAKGAARYFLKELFWTKDESIAGFAYPDPSVRNSAYNANFLASDLLCRIYKHTGEQELVDAALRVTRHAAAKQRDDGAWYYGEAPQQRWIDNFHTGYNLCSLRSIGESLGISEFEPRVRAGFEFYRKHFFLEDGAPRYFHDRTYPIDGHCVAQSLITLVGLRDLDEGNLALADQVVDWSLANMLDNRGYFYYRVFPHYRDKTSYMRWVQAWMLLALSVVLEQRIET